MSARFILVLSGLLAFGAIAEAQSNSLIMLQVERVKTKEDAVRKKELMSLNVNKDAMNPGTTWVSMPKDVDFIYASQTIEASVHNGGKDNVICDLRVVFFMEDQNTGERKIQSSHKEKLVLQPGTVAHKQVTSSKTRFSRQTVKVDGESKKIGCQPDGYLVVLSDDTGPFKWLGSVEVARDFRTLETVSTVLNDKQVKALDQEALAGAQAKDSKKPIEPLNR